MIAKMDRVEIVCLRDSLPRVIPFLHDRGLLDVEEVPLDGSAVPNFLSRVDLPEEQQAESTRLEDLGKMLREIVPLVAQKPSPAAISGAVTRFQAIPQDDYRGHARQWHRQLRAMSRRRTNVRDNLEILSNYRQLLESLAPLLGSRKVSFGSDARAIVLKGDVSRAAGQLEDRLRAVVGPQVEFIHRSVARNHLVGVLLYPEDKNDAVGRVLREEGIIPVDTPSKDGAGAVLSDVLAKANANVSTQKEALAKIEAEMDEYATVHGADLVAMSRIVNDALDEFRVVNSFAESEMITVMHGWAPADEVSILQSGLDSAFPGEVMVNTLSSHGISQGAIPTLLHNPKWLKPFEVLLKILQPPTYGTYDATLLVAVAFVLFYGFIVGDAVYGLAVLGFAHFLRKKWGHNQIVDAAGKVGYCMGASTIMFGVLFGEYLGNAGELAWLSMTGEHRMPLQVMHRFNEMIPLLTIAVIIGFVHIVLSLLLGVRESLRHNHIGHALEKGGMLAGLLGIVVLVLNLANISIIGSGVFLFVAGALYIGGAIAILRGMGAMGLIGILEIFSLVGNVLSYARLMALGIAGVIIADLANELPHGIGVIGYPVALLIHLFNIAVILFSPTLHSLRLNYVEFLPKFYEPKGRNYKPFRKEAQW
jgi:V/A-type H+-transporting ATPase subunit I